MRDYAYFFLFLLLFTACVTKLQKPVSFYENELINEVLVKETVGGEVSKGVTTKIQVKLNESLSTDIVLLSIFFRGNTNELFSSTPFSYEALIEGILPGTENFIHQETGQIINRDECVIAFRNKRGKISFSKFSVEELPRLVLPSLPK